MTKRLPGKLAHTLAILLTLLMTLTLLCSVLSWQGVRLLTDKELHQGIASDPAVTAAQMARITSVVDKVAAAQSFDPATVHALISEDAVRAHSINAADWWMGLLQPNPVFAAPQWDTDAIQEAVRADALFQESVRATLRRSVARDKVAYPIGNAIQEAVLPIRSQLITLAMPEVLERIDVPTLVKLFAYVPLAMAGASVALALLIILTMHRKVCKGGLYIGSALAAASLLMLGLMLTLYLADPAALVAQANAILGMQTGLLLSQLALPLGIVCAAGLLCGLILIAVHQRVMRKSAMQTADA